VSAESGLRKRIDRRTAHVAVIGLGYVGLPLALEIVRRGYRTVGIDVAEERVRSAEAGVSYIDDVSNADLKSARRGGRFSATHRFEALARADVAIICVPTPLGKTRQPDLSYVLAAVEKVARHLRKGQLVILESTTYPGTTDEHLRPIFEAGGLRAERDFFLGFSPERVDPGNLHFAITEVPKVVGGIGPRSTRLMGRFYGNVFREVVPVSSARAAEMVKLLENTFRSINIGLANEMAMVCQTLEVDIWEVIAAAKTKPFGFMAFYPGPGIGGHCINIDPMYLAWKARLHGYEPRLIELAQTINDEMPKLVVQRAAAILNECDRPLKGSRILLLGLSYKKNVRDTRESPSLTVFAELLRAGAAVSYHDPYVPRVRLNGGAFRSKKLTPGLVRRQHLVIILTDHDRVDYRLLAASAVPVFDTRNALAGAKKRPGVHRL
jgi:UDP-N-acetyl-D-glucosamine dehydrogenase